MLPLIQLSPTKNLYFLPTPPHWLAQLIGLLHQKSSAQLTAWQRILLAFFKKLKGRVGDVLFSAGAFEKKHSSLISPSSLGCLGTTALNTAAGLLAAKGA